MWKANFTSCLSLILLFSFLIFPENAHSATLLVPMQYPTIQAAVDAATNGDTVKVSPGTYTHFTVDQKIVYVVSTSGPDHTVINGYHLFSPVVFYECGSGGNRLGVEGFTIQNGTGISVGNVLCGGGIFCRNSSPVIKNNIIRNNTAERGGGICCFTENPTYTCAPNIIYNTITENEVNGGGHGGGICLWLMKDTVTIKGNNITYNEADDSGGGIYIRTHPSGGIGVRFVIEGNYINGNQAWCDPAAGGIGGGIHALPAGLFSIIDNEVSNNSAHSGGGVSIAKQSPSDSDLIRHNLIHHNVAVGDGSGDGGGVLIDADGLVNFFNNAVYENTAQGGYGGGICVFLGAPSTKNFVNNTISWNSAPTGTGGGVYLVKGTNISFSNEIIWGNTAFTNPGNELDFDYPNHTSPPTVNYCDVEHWQTPNVPWQPGQNNIYQDPLFPAAGDIHLASGSPCYMAGSNGLVQTQVDIDREPRIMPLASGIVEMGADEIRE